MSRMLSRFAVPVLALVLFCGCSPHGMRVRLEVFLLSLMDDGDTVQYAKISEDLTARSVDPDGAARELAQPHGVPVLLHSTSWRWEQDGTIVLTYLAYFERLDAGGLRPVSLPRSALVPPPPTDPQRPRPTVIREQDVLAHGIRHLGFLVRYARDERILAALSPRSLSFFRALCGQLAGRFESAREFVECTAVDAR
jgi:hypothetical protein